MLELRVVHLDVTHRNLMKKARRAHGDSEYLLAFDGG